MKNAGRSYWEKELYESVYDLIVVGAGLTGQSLAYFFKAKNPQAKVLVLDRGFYPIGASTRNAGFACFGSVTEHISDMELEEESKIIDRIKRRYEGLNLLRNTLGDHNIQFEETGGYEIFTNQEAYQEALDKMGMCNSWLIEATGKEDVYSASEYNGFTAIRIELEGALHPGKMMKTLYAKNIEQGIEFRWQSLVEEIDPEAGVIYLQHDNELKSEQIAVATNSFTSSLLKDVDVNPGRGYVFVTKPVSDLSWKGTFHYDRGYYYFRNIGEDRLLLGGARSLDVEEETTSSFGINSKIKKHLAEFASEILTLPEGWEIEQEWSGIMGFTKSKSPVFKKAGNKCLVAAGLSGMGVALGMQLGKEGAEKIAGF